jgi:hypothetical protein
MAADLIVLITTGIKTKSSSGGEFLLCQITKSKIQPGRVNNKYLLLAKAAPRAVDPFILYLYGEKLMVL